MISPSLLIAYRQTSYQVGGIKIRIGRRSPAMDRLLLLAAAQEAAFITAYNPYSRRMPFGWNQRMQARLTAAMRRHQLIPANGHWRRWSEGHLLALADARQVRTVARQFRQNGIVIVRRGQPARLLATC
jgi:uncharacterized protein DUF3293